jgi:NTP pyrophosphatase (non-canonical NTP hydrolase)
MSMDTIPAKVISRIVAHYEHAMKKHPGNALLNLSLQEELGELARAQLEQDEKQTAQEAYDCIAVLIRIIMEGDGSVDEFHRRKGDQG